MGLLLKLRLTLLRRPEPKFEVRPQHRDNAAMAEFSPSDAAAELFGETLATSLVLSEAEGEEKDVVIEELLLAKRFGGPGRVPEPSRRAEGTGRRDWRGTDCCFDLDIASRNVRHLTNHGC